MKRSTISIGVRLLFVMVCVAGCVFFSSPSWCAPRKNVLILHNFNQDHPAIADYDRGIIDVLLADDRFDVRTSCEYLNLADFEQDREYIGETAAYLSMKYAQWKPDAIVLDKAVFPLFDNYLRASFGDIPVFIPGERNDTVGQFVPPNTTIVSWSISDADVERNIELILRLRPHTRKIYAVLGTSVEERHIQRRLEAVKEKYAARISILPTDALPYAAMLERIGHASGDAVVLYLRFALDTDGRSYIPARVLDEICRRSPVPVFLMASHLLGTGAVGGFVQDQGALGSRMGRLVLDSLDGRNPAGGKEVAGAPSRYVFDARALARWSFAVSILPRGSIVRFRAHGLWELYRGYILGGMALFLFEAVLIFGLVVNRLRRQKAEAALMALNMSLEDRVLERTRELHTSNEALGQAKAELEAVNAQLETMSRTDSLTGLANRRRGEESLGDRHRDFTRYGTVYSLAMLDVDHFKRVNDIHGHEAGDSLLRQLAADLAGGIRESDLAVRWGGEEFLLLLPVTDAAAAGTFVERIRANIAARRYVCRDVELTVTLTGGVSTVRKGDVPEDVLRRADDALYKGKADGRNRVEMG
jgi:diguanylate cyclase (GGDEF)-like protein